MYPERIDKAFRRLFPLLFDRNREHARQARLLCGVAVVSIPIFIGFGLRQIYTHHLLVPGLILSSGSLVAFATLFLLRTNRSASVAVHLLGAYICLGLGAISYIRGGFVIGVLMWTMAVPLATILLHRRRWLYLWSSFLFIEYTVLFALQRHGIPGTEILHGPGYPAAVSLLAFITVASLFYWKGRTQIELEKRTLERQVAEQQRVEALGRLAGGIAHDFNNLLTVTRTHASMALEELGEEHQVAGDLKTIEEAAERGAALARQLLALGNRDVVHQESFDPNDLVRGVERLLRRVLPENIVFELALDPAAGHIHADRYQIEQVVMNLTVNARDAMPDGGRLRIVSEGVELPNADDSLELPPGPYVRLTVEDTGVGVAEDVLPHLFEPFFTTKGAEGTGLGLATSYAIVHRAGGELTVTTRLGEGTVFSAWLPQIDAPVRLEPSRDRALSRARVEGVTLLLAEDEKPVRDAARRILERRGYRVLCAKDGEHALEVVDGHDGAVDLLLTDVVMPRLGGCQLASELRQRYPEIKIVYTSGHADNQGVSEEVAAEVATFLRKPYDNQQLVRQVQDALQLEASTDSSFGAPA